MFSRNEEKNKQLIDLRGISFEDIIHAIETGGLLDDITHHSSKYPHQRILIVTIDHYVYKIPYVIDGEVYFLKTIYPDRHATALYLA